ncbi:MAG: hypothetical protein NVS4B8_05980 [Herpetosiphon sp.]
MGRTTLWVLQLQVIGGSKINKMSLLRNMFALLVQVLYFLVIARFVLSWIDMRTEWRLTQVIHELTEPLLSPIRQLIPNIAGLDLSPMIALLLLQLIARAL